MVQFFVKIPLKYFPLFISFCCIYLKLIFTFVETKKEKKMAKYFKIATAQVRPLQMKNCYDWTLVRYDSESNNCYLVLGQKLNVLPLSDVMAIHKNITRQRPYGIKTVSVAEFYGAGLAIIDYSAENNLDSQLLNNNILNQAKQIEKTWPGHILKPVNDLSFLKN